MRHGAVTLTSASGAVLWFYWALGPQLVGSDIADLPGVPESQTWCSGWVVGPLNYALVVNDAARWLGKLSSGAYTEEGLTQLSCLSHFLTLSLCPDWLPWSEHVLYLFHRVLLWNTLSYHSLNQWGQPITS